MTDRTPQEAAQNMRSRAKVQGIWMLDVDGVFMGNDNKHPEGGVSEKAHRITYQVIGAMFGLDGDIDLIKWDIEGPDPQGRNRMTKINGRNGRDILRAIAHGTEADGFGPEAAAFKAALEDRETVKKVALQLLGYYDGMEDSDPAAYKEILKKYEVKMEEFDQASCNDALECSIRLIADLRDELLGDMLVWTMEDRYPPEGRPAFQLPPAVMAAIPAKEQLAIKESFVLDPATAEFIVQATEMGDEGALRVLYSSSPTRYIEAVFCAAARSMKSDEATRDRLKQRFGFQDDAALDHYLDERSINEHSLFGPDAALQGAVGCNWVYKAEDGWIPGQGRRLLVTTKTRADGKLDNAFGKPDWKGAALLKRYMRVLISEMEDGTSFDDAMAQLEGEVDGGGINPAYDRRVSGEPIEGPLYMAGDSGGSDMDTALAIKTLDVTPWGVSERAGVYLGRNNEDLFLSRFKKESQSREPDILPLVGLRDMVDFIQYGPEAYAELWDQRREAAGGDASRIPTWQELSSNPALRAIERMHAVYEQQTTLRPEDGEFRRPASFDGKN